MATEAQTEREVIRCPYCNLNQYMTRSGLCRKPDCRKPLKRLSHVLVDEAMNNNLVELYYATKGGNMPEFYRPETPFVMPTASNVRFRNGKPYKVTPRISQDPLAEADAALAMLKKVLKSNVRRRGKPLTKINKQPRFRNEGLTILDFPTELRFSCMEYAAAHGMTLREVVIKSLRETIDKG